MKNKEWLYIALLFLIWGVINLALAHNEETAIFYNGERLDIAVENETVKTADFLQKSRIETIFEQEYYSLKDLCAYLGINYSFNQKDNIYALGDTAEYAREIPVLMYHHLLPESELWQRKRDNITITVEEFTAQMNYLADNSWNCVSLQDLEARILSGVISAAPDRH